MITIQEHSRVMDAARAAARSSIRRLMVSKPAKVLWQLAGVRVFDGQETIEAEVFQGVGFASLPDSSGVPEAIVVNVGSANTPVIVATRDEKTRAATLPASFSAGETIVFTRSSIAYLRDGRIELRTPTGVASKLATLADLQALREWIMAHVHPAPGGQTSAPSQTPPTPSPTGTVVLHAE